MSKMKICLVGGGGFLGHNLVDAWRNESRVDLTIADLKRPDFPIQNFCSVDLLDSKSIAPAIDSSDIVINLTGQVSRPMSRCLELNSVGIANLASALRPSQKFVQISSVAVYGACERADESETEVNPETPYGTAKLVAEDLLKNAVSPEKLLCLRLPNLYGPFQLKGVIAYLLRSFRSDRELEFDNDGSLLRYYLHTEDCARLLLDLLRREAYGFFNIPGEGPYTVSELIEKAESALDCRFSKRFESIAPVENIKSLAVEKFKRIAEFNPRWTIETFLRDQVK